MLPLFLNTFVREYRNKFLHFITIITLLLIFLFHSVQMNFTVNQQSQATMNMGAQELMIFFYRAIFFWSTVMSAMIGAQIVRNDIDSKMILQVLSFPVGRIEYLAARVLSAWVIVLSYYLFSILLFGAVSLFQNGSTGFSWELFASLAISSFAILSVIILAVLASLFFQKIPSFLFTLVLTTLIWIAVDYFSMLGIPSGGWSQVSWNVMTTGGFLLYLFFPHVSVINNIALSVLHQVSVLPNLWLEVPHFMLTLVLWSGVTWFLLRRKEF